MLRGVSKGSGFWMLWKLAVWEDILPRYLQILSVMIDSLLCTFTKLSRVSDCIELHFHLLSFQALQFLGLLSGSFSKYMPLLIVDRLNVLSDLPVTLTSLLLEDTSWRVVAESVVSHLWSSTVRIHAWTMHKSGADNALSQQSIDRSEDDKSVFLLQVMHHACVSLKEFLPPAKQLGLAYMVVPCSSTVLGYVGKSWKCNL